MAKAQTSKKQKTSSSSDVPIVKLKPGVKTARWDVTKEILNKDKVAKALFECLVDGDTEAFKEILTGYIEAHNISKMSKEARIPRRTIYAALSKKGNPSLETIAKLMHQAFAKVS